MADGYMFAEINKAGEIRVLEHQFLDQELYWVEFEEGDAADYMLGQLPKELVDAYVLVTFKYACNGSYDSFAGDYDFDETYTVLDHVVLREDYKEFSRKQLSMELQGFEDKDIQGLYFGLDDTNDYEKAVKDAILEWEEFHDEDFELFQKKVVQKNPASFLFGEPLRGEEDQ